jgi:hypothetical protein
MGNMRGIAQDIVLSALPFAFAMYLSYSTLSHLVRTNLKEWEPAFYSFLPMCFFFVGLSVFISRREIRELRDKIARLGTSAV